VHPLVRARERAFVAAARRRRDRLVVLDVPLLFESRGTRGLDLIVAVSAPRAIQRKRVLTRGVMSAVQLDAVLARQWPDARRRRGADTVVPTGLSRHHAQAMIRRIVAGLRTA
jgi:dephospho-CoA kinase